MLLTILDPTMNKSEREAENLAEILKYHHFATEDLGKYFDLKR